MLDEARLNLLLYTELTHVVLLSTSFASMGDGVCGVRRSRATSYCSSVGFDFFRVAFLLTQ